MWGGGGDHNNHQSHASIWCTRADYEKLAAEYAVVVVVGNVVTAKKLWFAYPRHKL